MTKLRPRTWVAIAVAATLVVLVIAVAWASRSEPLRKLVIVTLADRLNSEVDLAAFSVDAIPNVTIRGEGLILRLRGIDRSIPPLIEIKSFTVSCGIMDLFRRPRRFKLVTLEGLVVNIPPGGLRERGNTIKGALGGITSSGDSSDAGGAQDRSPIVVDELRSQDAVLRIIPRTPGKAPREFAIHTLTMQSLGVAQQMPFTATLTNPIPKGFIETNGTFGPWNKDEPSRTQLAGNYRFKEADLGTIDGIGGILTSNGAFSGVLERIAVKGDTHTPDFRLDISEHPVPLSTSFQAVVDGTNGDTYLDEVNAQFLQTALTAKGAVAGTEGVKGRTIKLNVHIQEGRIEDLLFLAVKGDKPLMVGRVELRTDFELPPGKRDVIARLILSGQFLVGAATFTDPSVQKKLTAMSKRARGLDEDEKAGNVVSDLRGHVRMKNAALSFSDLTFSMPGATVSLYGSYNLRSEELSFDGNLRMQATISEAAGGGVKSFFLKLVDPIFRKKGAGAVVPIRVRGTREQPKFGLDVGRVFKRR